MEVIDSNPVAFAVKKFVEHMIVSLRNNNTSNASRTLFKGPPAELLDKLNSVAIQNKINTQAREWPKDQKWLIRRLNTIKSNLQDELDITINIDRESKTNTSIIEIYKNDSDDSELGITPEANRLLQSVNDEYNKNDVKSFTYEDDKNTEVFDSGDNGINGDTLSNVSLSDNAEENISETKNTIKDNEFIQNGVSFDLEWMPIDYSEGNEKNGKSDNMFTKITAAAFVDGKGNQKVMHIDDYSAFGDKAEANLLIQINKELSNYRYSYGWNSTSVAKYDKVTGKYLNGIDSDLIILDNRCKANAVESLISYDKANIPFLNCIGHTHIDLYYIFSKPMIQTTIFNNICRTFKLDDVSKAILGKDKGGKLEGMNGKNIVTLSVEKQKKYVLRDAQLVMDLVSHNDAEILDCMKSLSEITGLEFERVYRTGLSSWWASIFDNMKLNHTYTNLVSTITSDNLVNNTCQRSYNGGTVLEFKKGYYENLDIVDVTSLYPSMAILYNISPETVNCKCCKNDPEARLNKKIIQNCTIEKEYWICRLREGAFPNKLKKFKQERITQKNEGNKVKQLALKILINGGYGVFGNDYFKYHDKRVAELITAYGRFTLDKMREKALAQGFEVIAGDIDSLFLHSKLDKTKNKIRLEDFINECKDTSKIDVEHEKTFTKAIILKKKHYVGITKHGEIIIKGMEGIKNDRPQWINSVFESILKDILIYGNNPLIRIKEELQKLKEKKIDLETLKIYTKLSKNPQDYKSNNIQKKIGILLDAKANDLIYHFKSDNKDGVSISSKEISLKKYEDMLIDNVREVLQVIGHDVSKLYS